MNDYPAATWRLIHTLPADGATQMAIDEALWLAVAAGESPPTLRLYGWRPPCLSLGRHQPSAEADLDAVSAAGYDVVRRPTGGRAILHIDELTYSIATPLSDPRVAGDIATSCARLSAGLLLAVQRMGATDATAHRRDRPADAPQPVCFEEAGHFEIIVGEKKLIGSAQMRGRGALLQHGALPLHGDIARIAALLHPLADPARIHRRATTLADAIGRSVAWKEAAAAVADGFAQALNLRLEPAGLTTEEETTARRLRDEKYATPEWTTRL